MARAATRSPEDTMQAIAFINNQLTIRSLSKGAELFAGFLVDSMDPGSDTRQLSEETIANIFSGKLKRGPMRSLVEEIGARGEVGGFCWSLGKIDESARKSRSGLSPEAQTTVTVLSGNFRQYLGDYSYFLQQAIDNKTEKKASGGIAMKVFGSGAIPRTEGDPERPKLPAEAEVDAVMEYARNEVVIEELGKMLSELKLAELERRLAELTGGGSGRGGSGPSGGAASASAASLGHDSRGGGRT